MSRKSTSVHHFDGNRRRSARSASGSPTPSSDRSSLSGTKGNGLDEVPFWKINEQRYPPTFVHGNGNASQTMSALASSPAFSSTAATATVAAGPLLKQPASQTAYLPSVGSAGHAEGNCAPCLFWLSQRCLKGRHCMYCHIVHKGQKKKRIRPSKRTRELRKGIASGQQPHYELEEEPPQQAPAAAQPAAAALQMLMLTLDEMFKDFRPIIPDLLHKARNRASEPGAQFDPQQLLVTLLSREIIDPILKKFDEQSGHVLDLRDACKVLHSRLVINLTKTLQEHEVHLYKRGEGESCFGGLLLAASQSRV